MAVVLEEAGADLAEVVDPVSDQEAVDRVAVAVWGYLCCLRLALRGNGVVGQREHQPVAQAEAHVVGC